MLKIGDIRKIMFPTGDIHIGVVVIINGEKGYGLICEDGELRGCPTNSNCHIVKLEPAVRERFNNLCKVWLEWKELEKERLEVCRKYNSKCVELEKLGYKGL